MVKRVKPTFGYLGGLYWLPLAYNQNLIRGIWKRLQEKKNEKLVSYQEFIVCVVDSNDLS